MSLRSSPAPPPVSSPGQGAMRQCGEGMGQHTWTLGTEEGCFDHGAIALGRNVCLNSGDATFFIHLEISAPMQELAVCRQN